MSHVIQAVIQLLVVVVLVTIFWGCARLVARRRKAAPQGWSRWLGLYLPPPDSRRWWLFPLTVLLAWVVTYLEFAWIEGFAEFSQTTPAYKISREQGLSLLLGALAYPFVTSALTEEILFRGFLAKRLMGCLGNTWGNLVQTGLFLAPHLLLVKLSGAEAGAPMLVLFVVLTVGPMAWVSGHLMEARDGGSLLSPWLIHAGANFGTLVYFWLWVP